MALITCCEFSETFVLFTRCAKMGSVQNPEPPSMTAKMAMTGEPERSGETPLLETESSDSAFVSRIWARDCGGMVVPRKFFPCVRKKISLSIHFG